MEPPLIKLKTMSSFPLLLLTIIFINAKTSTTAHIPAAGAGRSTTTPKTRGSSHLLQQQMPSFRTAVPSNKPPKLLSAENTPLPSRLPFDNKVTTDDNNRFITTTAFTGGVKTNHRAAVNRGRKTSPAVEPPDNVELYEWEARLFSYLFEERGYSNRARPARKSGPVEVSLELIILKINEILEIDQEIVISGYLKINWTDFRLSWRKENFGGIDRVVTEVANIWLPDLALINSDDVYAITRDGRFPITLYSSGSMLYVPAGKINARCELNLRYFPFDSQLCHFRFESWVYSESSVKVVGNNLAIDIGHFIQNPQWALIDSLSRTTVAPYDNLNFSRVEFYVFLQRKSLFFLTYTVFPCGIISCLQMLSHILPLAESERVNFGTTTLVAFAVFHISVVEQVPKSSEAIPLLAIYVDSLMCLIGCSLMESFLMLNWLSHVSFTVPPPFLWYYVVEKMGNYLWLGQNGLHWRRNYLRVLAKVRCRMNQTGAPPLANNKQAFIKEQRAQFLRYCTTIYKGYSPRNIDAIIKLMAKYGSLLGDISQLNNRQCNTNCDVLYSSSVFSTRRRFPADVNHCPLRDKRREENCALRRSHSDDEQQPSKRQQFVNFNNGDDSNLIFDTATSPSKQQATMTTMLNDDNATPCSNVEMMRRQIDSQLKELREVGLMLEEIQSGLSHHSLKRECHGVWTVYITAFDRIASFLLFFVCSFIPLYLFFIYPETITKEQMRCQLLIGGSCKKI